MAAPPLVYGRFKAPEAPAGTLDVYEAGSLSNRKTTYSLPGLTSANANPVVLDSLGEADIFYSGLARLVLKNASGSQIWDKDNIGLTGDTSSQWINSLTATYGSSTTFTLSGDQTTEYHVGRRVRLTGSSVAYGDITISSYSAPNTTVTVSVSSGSIDVTLASAAVGIISATNESVAPATIFRPSVTGYVSGAITYLHTDGANATTFDLTAITENTFESVGPTGSSATNIWTAMDDIPAGARIAIVNFEIQWDATAADTVAGMDLYARATGSVVGTGTQTVLMYFRHTPDDDVTDPNLFGDTYLIPLDSSRRLDLTWNVVNASVTTLVASLRGFIL